MENDSVKFKNFITLAFPNFPKIQAVYIFYLVKQRREIPFYIGESGNLRRRIGEYVAANFQCPTDFVVGEAIYYFQEKDFNIIIKYKLTDSRRKEQNQIIDYFQGLGIKLLNELRSYDYKKADKDEESKRIRQFCDVILNQ